MKAPFQPFDFSSSMVVFWGFTGKNLKTICLPPPPFNRIHDTRGYMSPDNRRFWHRKDVEKQVGPLAEAPEKEAKDESARDFPV